MTQRVKMGERRRRQDERFRAELLRAGVTNPIVTYSRGELVLVGVDLAMPGAVSYGYVSPRLVYNAPPRFFVNEALIWSDFRRRYASTRSGWAALRTEAPYARPRWGLRRHRTSTPKPELLLTTEDRLRRPWAEMQHVIDHCNGKVAEAILRQGDL